MNPWTKQNTAGETMSDVNREALRELREVAIRAPDELFHMRWFQRKTSCGTARCLLGWALDDVILGPLLMDSGADPTDFDDSLDAATDLFGLSQRDATNLFGGDLCSGGDPHSVTKAEVLWNIDQILKGECTLPYQATVSIYEKVLCHELDPSKYVPR